MSNAGAKTKGASRAAEWLDLLLPESGEQSGTAFADRQTRRRTVHKIERTFDQAAETFHRIQEALDEEEAHAEQREWNDRDRRRESEEHIREREENRKDIRLFVEVEERRRALRRKDVMLGLIVFTVLAAMVLAFMAVQRKELGFAGASVFTTGCWMYLLRSLLGGGRQHSTSTPSRSRS